MTSILRLLNVSFDTHLQPWELPQFRGAVARKVGLEHEWFHNHNNETGGYHHRYPLIQYKLDTQKDKMRPMLLCLDRGIEEAHHFFSQPDWGLRIGEHDHAMRIAQLDVRQHNLQMVERPLPYRIHKWKPFNTENFMHWRSLRGVAEQFDFLERLMTAHIIAFASGVGWQIPGHFEVKITNLLKKEEISQQGIRSQAFTLEFDTQLSLPDYVGLGKQVSFGFGVLRRQRRGKRDD
jgi:hypothetical protein